MRRRIVRWAGTGFWALADQGLFAASNFGLSVSLARWLAPTDYGAFAVSLAVFTIVGAIHTSVFSEPLLVFGSGKYRARLWSYLRVLVGSHFLFGGIVTIGFATGGIVLLVLGASPLSPCLLGLSLAAPAILFQWLMRRACYVNLNSRLAASAGGMYFFILAVSVVTLELVGLLGSFSAFVVMGASSAVAAVWILARLRAASDLDSPATPAREVVRDHWTYGRWATAASVLMWLPGDSYQLLLPAWWGLNASASYRAVTNLILPIMNFNTALGRLLVPSLVPLSRRPGFGARIVRLALLFVVAPLVYFVCLGTLARTAVHLLYGPRYESIIGLVWIAGLVPLVAAASAVSGAALRALEMPSLVFIAYLCSAVVAMSAGLILVRNLGVEGALVGWVLSYATSAMVLALVLWRYQKRVV